jgi:hypothetical protein
MLGVNHPGPDVPHAFDTLPFEPFGNQPLSTDELDQLRWNTNLTFCWSWPSTHPQECDAISAMAERLDPANSLLVSANFGFAPYQNDPRYRDGSPDTEITAEMRRRAADEAAEALQAMRSAPGGQPSRLDSHTLANKIAQARRVPFVFADFSDRDIIVWQDYNKAHNGSQLPSRAALSEAFCSANYHLDFTQASHEYAALLDNVNDTSGRWADGSLRTDYRWGEMTRQRDRLAVNTLGHAAVQQLLWRPPTEQKLEVVGLFTPDRQGGIETRLHSAGLDFTSYVARPDHTYHQAERMPLDAHQAYDFAEAFLWFETRHGLNLGISRQELTLGLRQLPLDTVASIYETHRQRMLVINAKNASQNNTTDFLEASDALTRDIKRVWASQIAPL